jgi:hypothetical protein
MNQLLQNILIFFFAVNAIFWGLMPHSIHCSLVSNLLPECPSHNIHIGFGIFSFLVATIIAQYKHFL